MVIDLIVARNGHIVKMLVNSVEAHCIFTLTEMLVSATKNGYSVSTVPMTCDPTQVCITFTK